MYRDLFIFERSQDARHFAMLSGLGSRYLAVAYFELRERLRGLELQDVIVDPAVRLTPQDRHEILSRQRAPSHYIVEPGPNEFGELVRGAFG